MANQHEELIAKELGHDKSKPLIQFYDHAVRNNAKSEQCGRPRYDAKVYLRKVPTSPDRVVRDVFSRKMTEQDKHEYPTEWAQYLERKGGADNHNPPVTILPGMTVAAQAELKELRIFNCKQLVACERDLDDLEPLREIARKVLAITDDVMSQPVPVAVQVSNGHPGQSFHYEFRA